MIEEFSNWSQYLSQWRMAPTEKQEEEENFSCIFNWQ